MAGPSARERVAVFLLHLLLHLLLLEELRCIGPCTTLDGNTKSFELSSAEIETKTSKFPARPKWWTAPPPCLPYRPFLTLQLTPHLPPAIASLPRSLGLLLHTLYQISTSLAVFGCTDEQATVVRVIRPLHAVCPRPLCGVLAYAAPQGVLAWPVPCPSSMLALKTFVAVTRAVLFQSTPSDRHSIDYPAPLSSDRRGVYHTTSSSRCQFRGPSEHYTCPTSDEVRRLPTHSRVLDLGQRCS